MSDESPVINFPENEDGPAPADLLTAVYDELRKLAATRMAQEAPGQTLQPTALVHEAWLRLAGQHGSRFENRAQFFAAAAEAMRRILIEKARSKNCHKRGGGLKRVDWEFLDVAVATDDDALLAINDALNKLATVDATGAELIKLRFFVGMSNVEAARALGLGERTAKRTWAYARAWLHEELLRTR